MKLLKLAILLGVIAGTAAPAQTNPASEVLFAEGIFASEPDGRQIAYDHSRKGADATDTQALGEGRILLLTGRAEDGTQSLSLTIEDNGKTREIVDFPASGGNPVLMVFLESSVRNMASLTGGSPFYIRNRIKDSLRKATVTPADHDLAGTTVAAQEVTLHPFATDPNRDRMGQFADLSLHFVIADAAPGRFVLLSADTPDAEGYQETITLADSEAAE